MCEEWSKVLQQKQKLSRQITAGEWIEQDSTQIPKCATCFLNSVKCSAPEKLVGRVATWVAGEPVATERMGVKGTYAGLNCWYKKRRIWTVRFDPQYIFVEGIWLLMTWSCFCACAVSLKFHESLYKTHPAWWLQIGLLIEGGRRKHQKCGRADRNEITEVRHCEETAYRPVWSDPSWESFSKAAQKEGMQKELQYRIDRKV